MPHAIYWAVSFIMLFLLPKDSHLLPIFVDAIELMFVGIGFISLPITVLAYMRINARRDLKQREVDEKRIKYTDEDLRKMGDRAPDFRYTL